MWFRINTEKSLGEALASARKEANLSQEELAKRIQVDRTTVIRLEAGRLKTLTRVTSAFAMLGYDLVAVPRGSKLTVEEHREVTHDK